MNDSADVAHASLSSVISEEPQEFRHATSLDNALQHLIPTLQSHKGDLDPAFLYAGMFVSGTMHLSGIGFLCQSALHQDDNHRQFLYVGINFRNVFLIIACV